MPIDEEKYTKISIKKSLHSLVKTICEEKGRKMYHFEDEAIIEYIKNNYQSYANGHLKNIEKES